MITTYSSIIKEDGIEDLINKRIKRCKRIKSISYWRNKPNNILYKQAIIEFKK